jgi:lipopolysaccharide biosynthesis protein
VTSQSWHSNCNRCGKKLFWNRRDDLRNPETGKMRPFEDEGYTIAHSCVAPATAGTIFEQKPDAARDLFMKPAPATTFTNEIIVELQRVTTLLRDIASDTQRISRKLDEAFARLDARVQEARSK